MYKPLEFSKKGTFCDNPKSLISKQFQNTFNRFQPFGGGSDIHPQEPRNITIRELSLHPQQSATNLEQLRSLGSAKLSASRLKQMTSDKHTMLSANDCVCAPDAEAPMVARVNLFGSLCYIRRP